MHHYLPAQLLVSSNLWRRLLRRRKDRRLHLASSQDRTVLTAGHSELSSVPLQDFNEYVCLAGTVNCTVELLDRLYSR
jgi:hypothetical protein